MKRVKILIAVFILLICALGMMIDAEPALATSVISLSDEQLSSYSDYILHATIVSVEPFAYDERTILTRVVVRVHEFLKAPDDARPEVFEFYTRGGMVGDMVQTVQGEFSAVPGTEIVAFLEKIRKYDGLPMVLGLTQGAFVIESVPMTMRDRKTANRIHRNREFVTKEAEFDSVSDVEALKALIRKHVNQQENAHD